MKKYALAIIGGGFSGLCLANLLCENLKNDCVIFEKLDRVGKKLLSTGNGRGNFSNKNLNVAFYHGEDPAFVKTAIEKYDNEVIEGFFAKFGIPSAVEDGKVYPESLQSNALLDALRLSIGHIELRLNEEVRKIEKQGGAFAVTTKAGVYYFENVALCAGGKAAKNFGTDGSAYALARGLGHSVTELFPSIVQIKVDTERTKGLKGVKRPAEVSLYDGENLIARKFGDALFSDGYLSGNTAFYLSSYAHGLKKPFLSVDLVPNISETAAFDCLFKRKKDFPEENSTFLLSGIVHTAVAVKIAKGLFNNKKLKDLDANDLKKAIYELKNYKMDVLGTGSFDNAQVTRGGIRTSEIDDKTLMSKLCENLYFCGEIIDVDGDCGGYNLHWAFASASAVAEHLNEKYYNR